MPAWIVPVLRLVSATHVEPTTGVVISPTGLVLVPDDFASSDDEIIVLDGGTDIIRNGRPAKIAYQFPAQGLMVLSVKSLKRKVARFTAGDLADGSSVRLQAFPPAKLIEQGAPPVDVSATIYIHPQSKKATLSSATPLPNVTGPILDACGRLTGYSTADGLQSMSTTESPRYHWKDSLLAILNEMQIDIIELPCEQLPSAPEPQDETIVETVDEINDGKPGDDEPDLEEESLSALDVLPPLEEIDEDADEDSGLPAWVWLLASIFLLVSAFILHRIRNNRSLNAQAQAGQPSSALAPEGDEEPAYPVPGLDSLLVIEGILSDGTEFRHSCKVSHNAINLVIGRGNADINIDSSAISRQHVSLNGTREMLTMTDLGSSNGSSINGIPCLEGETMFIEPGDIIILGNARFSYNIIPAKQT
ncbi:MAG: FHA domain-containing protein [Proteobacteria bacterium]|nr:FHA domain-containing protein [Pseudomonadota bacterium]